MKYFLVTNIDNTTTLARLQYRPKSWQDENDIISECSEIVVRWCSNHGYSYDECNWEFVDWDLFQALSLTMKIG